MERKARWKLAAGVLLLLLCLFCAGCAGSDEVRNNHPQVYITYGTSNTTTEYWDSKYGVISRDGTLILPLEQRMVSIICDDKTGEQLWLQTREQYVDDPTLKAGDLYENNNWEHIRNVYALYDLEGNLQQELGERSVQAVYGDWILYNDGKLESRTDGAILFDDVDDFCVSGDTLVLNYHGSNKVCAFDKNQQLLWKRDGEVNAMQADKPIILWQDTGMGLIALDGTELVPCQYDYIQYAAGADVCIAQQKNGKSAVLSSKDGSVLYETTGTGFEIYYADDTVVILRSWEADATGTQNLRVQMYNYAGQAISDVYGSMYNESEDIMGLKTPLFMADTVDNVPVLLNQQGQEIYRGAAGQWLNLLTAERVIVNDQSKEENRYILQTLDGEVLNQKNYNGMYPVYLNVTGYSYSQKVPMVLADYEFGHTTLFDLLDADGNILIEQAKSIRALDNDRFWVEKGFSQGLMDREGNWLYKQSLFDSSVDE